MAGSDDVLKTLDAKITETERELERLKRAAELLPIVSTNLQALRRSRAILAGENPDGVTQDVKLGESLHVLDGAARPVVSGSVGVLAVEILKQTGKAMHARELTEGIRAKGRDVRFPTVVGALVRYVKAGQVRRTAPNTYALPKVG